MPGIVRTLCILCTLLLLSSGAPSFVPCTPIQQVQIHRKYGRGLSSSLRSQERVREKKALSNLIAASDDRLYILRKVEKASESDLDAKAATAAWDRLSQRRIASAPPARHRPPLYEDRAFLTLLNRTSYLVPALRPAHLTSILSSLAKLRYRPDDQVIDSMLYYALRSSAFPTFSQAARLLVACAKLDHPINAQYVERLATIMSKTLLYDLDCCRDNVMMEALALALWALVVLGCLEQYQELVETIIMDVTVRLQAAHQRQRVPGQLSRRETKGLVRVCRYLKTALLLMPREEVRSREEVARALEAAIEDVWGGVGDYLSPFHTSRLQSEVEGVLKEAGARVKSEWEAGGLGGGLSVDIVLHPLEHSGVSGSVAIEVDGPSHFFANQPRRYTGDTLIKQQALRLGYPGQWAAVLSVPHFEWPRSSRRKQLAVLKRKMKEAYLWRRDFLPNR